jgi:hypothetical protein
MMLLSLEMVKRPTNMYCIIVLSSIVFESFHRMNTKSSFFSPSIQQEALLRVPRGTHRPVHRVLVLVAVAILVVASTCVTRFTCSV